MKLSTKGRYGLRALLELAQYHANGPLPLKSIARSQEISAKYLEQLFMPLKGAGLVKSVRGSQGGYTLAKQPHEINLYDILSALEGGLNFVDCLGDPQICERSDKCAARLIWEEMNLRVKNYLCGITLADMMQKKKDLDLLLQAES